MAFNEVVKGEWRGKAPSVNSVRLYRNKNILKISVSKDILTALGNPIFFRVAIGTGKHAGLVALIPTRAKSANAYQVNDKSGAIVLTANKVGDLACENTVKVPHEITDDGLIIDVRPVSTLAVAA